MKRSIIGLIAILLVVACIGQVKQTGWTTNSVPATAREALEITNSYTWITYLLGFAPATNTVTPSFEYITTTNFIGMATNYVEANFIPLSGYMTLVPSNNVLYLVTQTATNVVVNNEP